MDFVGIWVSVGWLKEIGVVVGCTECKYGVMAVVRDLRERGTNRSGGIGWDSIAGGDRRCLARDWVW